MSTTKWETVTKDPLFQKIDVEGGWMYRTILQNIDGATLAVALEFVPFSRVSKSVHQRDYPGVTTGRMSGENT